MRLYKRPRKLLEPRCGATQLTQKKIAVSMLATRRAQLFFSQGTSSIPCAAAQPAVQPGLPALDSAARAAVVSYRKSSPFVGGALRSKVEKRFIRELPTYVARHAAAHLAEKVESEY